MWGGGRQRSGEEGGDRRSGVQTERQREGSRHTKTKGDAGGRVDREAGRGDKQRDREGWVGKEAA